jgi:hypothetical protein
MKAIKAQHDLRGVKNGAGPSQARAAECQVSEIETLNSRLDAQPSRL